MKLNMWMIANRLKDYEIEARIDKNAAPILNSTLPYYAPGCVYISQISSDIICESDQGSILVRDMRLSDGYLLIQGIFDWYQNWLDEVDKAIMSNDFQDLTQLFQCAFGNPVMIQDSNYCLLGMSGPFGKNGIPPEWDYIRRNGQVSMEGYNFMSSALKFSDCVYRQNVRRFSGKPGSLMPDSGLHVTITFHGHDYEKLTVLESTRIFNEGDICLLEYLSRRMAIYTAAASGESRKYLDIGIIESLLLGESVPPDKVSDFQRIIKGQRPGAFAVLLINFYDRERKGDLRALKFIKNIIFRQYSIMFCNIIKGELMLLLYSQNPYILARQIFHSVSQGGRKKELHAGLSCLFHELSELQFFFDQALYAQCNGKEMFSEFYDLASEYLMESSGQRRVCACEPVLRRMWAEQDKRAYLETLRVYLEEERSSKRASERLYIHKNTLTYRIKFIKNTTNWNLDDPGMRNYLRLSLYALEKEELSVQQAKIY